MGVVNSSGVSRRLLTGVLTAVGVLAACSDDPGGARGEIEGGDPVRSGSGDGSVDFGNAPAGEGASGASPGTQPPPRDARVDCVGETQSAVQVDVDMYIMLDRSGSMLDLTGAGPTKWDAIRSALGDFVSDPASDGLGVGLQYFPLGAPGVPESCFDDSDCGMAGPCTSKVCLPSLNPNDPLPPVQLCLSAADCPANSAGCADFGTCSLLQNAVCFDFGPGGCGPDGACEPAAGECLLYASCEIDDYFQPAVPIAVLPDNGAALNDSLTMARPIGLTPTPVALAGAIAQASQYAVDNPTHRVLAVLATDGFPTDCLPPGTTEIEAAVDAVAAIAAEGVALDPRIETYVIGVFAPEDPNAMENLDVIAQAGGNERAFVVDPNRDVSRQFLDALSEIRGGSLACEFQLPEPPENQELDYGRVNVELTQAGDTRALRYVQVPDNCDQAELGWYYDADPEQGGMPTKISVCPDACEVLRAAAEASVEIRLGCATLGPD